VSITSRTSASVLAEFPPRAGARRVNEVRVPSEARDQPCRLISEAERPLA
jgi:hypothetical protein